MSLEGALDLMAPVQTSGGKTIWIKVGVFFPNDRRGGYVGTVSLLTLPVGATAPLELYAYPAKGNGKESGKPRGKKTRGAAPEYRDGSGNEADPFDPRDLESPGGDDPRGGV